MNRFMVRPVVAVIAVLVLTIVLGGCTVDESRTDFEDRQRPYYGVERNCESLGPREVIDFMNDASR